jgi:hypothetical protein
MNNEPLSPEKPAGQRRGVISELDVEAWEKTPSDVGRQYEIPRTGKMTPQISATLQWGFENERSLLAILWHYPEFVSVTQRDLDPAVHFSLRGHRYILEAIDVSYRHLGDVSWGTVVEVICEIPGAFDECGGKPGLNDVFTDEGRYPESVRNPEPIVTEYIRSLKQCAVIRGVDPSQPVLHHTTGRGYLRKNKLATKPEHPQAIGEIYVPMPGTYKLSGWPQGQDQLKITGHLQRSA